MIGLLYWLGSLLSGYRFRLILERRRVWEDMIRIFLAHGFLLCEEANMLSRFYTYVFVWIFNGWS